MEWSKRWGRNSQTWMEGEMWTSTENRSSEQKPDDRRLRWRSSAHDSRLKHTQQGGAPEWQRQALVWPGRRWKIEIGFHVIMRSYGFNFPKIVFNQQCVIIKIIVGWVWGGSSVDKITAREAWGPEFRSPKPHKCQAGIVAACNPNTQKTEMGNLQGKVDQSQ